MSQPLRKEFEALRARWQEHCQDGRLPCRSVFPPESLVPWIGHIQLVEVVREDDVARFRVRLVGTRIVYYQGQDNTGLFLDDVIPEDEREAILAPYRIAWTGANRSIVLSTVAGRRQYPPSLSG